MTTLFDAHSITSIDNLKQQQQQQQLQRHTPIKNDATSFVKDSYRIRVLGIAEQGAKSRVETQIRLFLELIDEHGEKVTDWSHLRLPDSLLTLKRRNASSSDSKNKKKSPSELQQEEQQRTIPEESVLHLRASVICESDVNRKVKMCQRCVWREWKRADRKKAGRRLGTTVYDETLMERERQRILLFNSDPLLAFNAGECVLPSRITCYSRHHDERQGFRIKFTMHDHQGHLVGSGDSPPIMITDDHKNLSKLGDKRRRRRRRKSVTVNESLPTPEEEKLATFDEVHGLSTTPAIAVSNDRYGIMADDEVKQEEDSFYGATLSGLLDADVFSKDKEVISSFTTLPTTSLTSTSSSSSVDTSCFMDPCVFFPTTPPPMQDLQLLLPSLWTSPSSSPTSIDIRSPPSSSPCSPLTLASAMTSPPLQQQSDQLSHHHPYENQHQQQQSLPPLTMLPPPMMGPRIERMIPDNASIEGGTEITLLGSNFYEGLTCYFGDQPALTAYWSPTTLVCTVPPASQTGPILVTLENPSSFMTSLCVAPSIFTYSQGLTDTSSSTSQQERPTTSLLMSPTTEATPSLTSPSPSSSSPSPSTQWDEQALVTLIWHVMHLNMAENIVEAREIALRMIQLQ